MPPKFAFLVHPRAQVAQDMARIWRPLGRVPEPAWAWGLRRLPVPPQLLTTVRRADDPDEVAGWVIVVPVGARQLLTEDRRWAVAKVEQAVDRAEQLGATTVGLGALTAPATGAGRLLRRREGMNFTTGNAFTAHLTVEALRRLLPAAPGGRIAVVGATGSVGSCVVRLLADDTEGISDLTLIARGARRLDDLAAEIREAAPGLPVRTSTSLDAVRDADLVLVLTSATDALIRSEHLKPGAIVLDDTQPRNTDPALREQRPDVLVVDGGVAATPGIQMPGDIGLPRGLSYACLCETMLMSFDGIRTDALGSADVDHARRMGEVAGRHEHLGFTLADPLSFGRPVSWPEPATTLGVAR
ncbi:MAG TPA: semialdehyde dehydrogenase [Microbacterium sp.]|nr:semialdehyde dehydrogenase [Microbacterium sp.]